MANIIRVVLYLLYLSERHEKRNVVQSKAHSTQFGVLRSYPPVHPIDKAYVVALPYWSAASGDVIPFHSSRAITSSLVPLLITVIHLLGNRQNFNWILNRLSSFCRYIIMSWRITFYYTVARLQTTSIYLPIHELLSTCFWWSPAHLRRPLQTATD